MINYEEQYAICGALPSPDDDRDYQLEQLVMKAVKLPSRFVVTTDPIIVDQGSVGSCVAQTLAQIKHCQEFKELGDNSKFSASYIYGNRKDDDFQGSGMYPRQALQNLLENGTCHDSDFPYDNSKEYEDVKSDYLDNEKLLDRKAKPYRISSYYRLNDLDDIKLALYTTNQYVQICYDVYKCLYYPNKDGLVEYNPILRGKNYGGHSMTVCGYDDEKEALLIINSWGEDYGVNGLIYIPYKYPFSESWCAIDAKTEKELIQKYQ